MATKIKKIKKTYTYKIYQNNELKKEFSGQINDFLPRLWLLANQNENSKIEQIDEQTQEVKILTP